MMTLTALDDLRAWIRAKYDPTPYYFGGHRFEKTIRGDVLVDRGLFELEEALEVGEMLLSQNPFARLAAILAIWEKNGTITKVVLGCTVVLLVIVLFIVTR